MPHSIKIPTNPDFFELSEKDSPQREIFVKDQQACSITLTYFDEKALTLFNALPEKIMPHLPFGYQWVRPTSKVGNFTVVKTAQAPNHQLELIVYGPEDNKINYNFLVDGANWQSFAHTKPKNLPTPSRKDVMKPADYRVSNYFGMGLAHCVRGHCIDHYDSMTSNGLAHCSSFSRKNYIPEPPGHWGLQMRRLIVAETRKTQGAYSQFTHYPETSMKTMDGTLVPDYVYFSTVAIDQTKKTLKLIVSAMYIILIGMGRSIFMRKNKNKKHKVFCRLVNHLRPI